MERRRKDEEEGESEMGLGVRGWYTERTAHEVSTARMSELADVNNKH